jgi:hypothetical protein
MEDMIRRRIKEGNFSDVLPPPPRKDGDADDTGNCRSLIERVKPRVFMRVWVLFLSTLLLYWSVVAVWIHSDACWRQFASDTPQDIARSTDC